MHALKCMLPSWQHLHCTHTCPHTCSPPTHTQTHIPAATYFCSPTSTFKVWLFTRKLSTSTNWIQTNRKASKHITLNHDCTMRGLCATHKDIISPCPSGMVQGLLPQHSHVNITLICPLKQPSLWGVAEVHIFLHSHRTIETPCIGGPLAQYTRCIVHIVVCCNPVQNGTS